MSIDLEQYVDVATRIAEFRDKHPEGSFQPANVERPFSLECMEDGKTYLVYVAKAFRSATDERPGIGCAWEEYPGRTPYTRGSELQNAETSAWGRAIVAALAADTRKGIATREEVAPRAAERELPEEPKARRISKPAVDRVIELLGLLNYDDAVLKGVISHDFGTDDIASLTVPQGKQLIERLEKKLSEVAA